MDNLQTYVERITNTQFKPAGNGNVHGPCPFCGGTDRFHIKGDKYWCRLGEGCGASGQTLEHLKKQLDDNPTYNDVQTTKPKADTTGPPDETYPYVVNGKLKYKVNRWGYGTGKQIRPENLEGKTKWPDKLYIYGHDLVKHSNSTILVSGEMCVDTWNKHYAKDTYPAWTTPSGEGNIDWALKTNPDLLEPLRERNVFILADNDETGRAWRDRMSALLYAKDCDVFIVDIPDLKQTEDIHDIHKRYGVEKTTDIIIDSLKHAEKWEPVVDVDPRFVRFTDICRTPMDLKLAQIDKRTQYLSPWLRKGEYIYIFGARGSKKTFFQLSIAKAVSDGLNLGPWESKNKGGVFILDGEMGEVDYKERLQIMNMFDSENVYIYLNELFSRALGWRRWRLDSNEDRMDFLEFMLSKGPDGIPSVLIIDNLVSFTSGRDENTTKDFSDINAWILELKSHGITTVLIHHEGKRDGTPRGTSAMEDNASFSINMKNIGDDYRAGVISMKVKFVKICEGIGEGKNDQFGWR